MDQKKVRIGAKVKIKPQHWLRALEDGTVVGYRPQSHHSWLVEFDRAFPGGGIEGDKLYFDEVEFVDVEWTNEIQHKNSSAPNGIDIYG